MNNISYKYQTLIDEFDRLELCGNVFVFEYDSAYFIQDYLKASFQALADLINHDAQSFIYETFPKELPNDISTPDLSADDLFQIEYMQFPREGKLISYQEFIGKEHLLHQQLSQNTWTFPEIDGIQNLILYPPCGCDIDLKLNERTQLYLTLKNELIPEQDELIIHNWNTDFCNYFQENDEWRESFLYTIQNKTRGEVWVILFSGTN